MIVVNPWNELPADYTFETTSLPNGESVDSRCFGALTQMLDACRNAGNVPVVCSSYRTHEKQIGLYEDQVKTEMAKGLGRKEAEIEAATAVAIPGTSEHELGLAVDICDNAYQTLDKNQENTDTQQWLMKHCWEYGFILRYPVDKGDITGIIYEPWHYRYVGPEAAREMYNGGNGWICLEEYLAQ
ncbi:MAG: M15 family metallopeptidase [Lachnospiraceae bacterium]|nr:D-alanyl-D-alanine carboxypeptidase family protein [Sarcina sp.]MBR2729343.1 M15 family metallopeptidase [Lachnospiraceae bacterium]